VNQLYSDIGVTVATQ